MRRQGKLRLACASLSVWAWIGGHAVAQDNLALNGVAAQSSDFSPAYAAERAIDGDFSNFTATATADDQATWEVDLGAPAEIDRIVVHNRGDGCCQSRLRDVTVSIYDISFVEDPFGDEEPLYQSELLNEENELGGGTTDGPPELAVDLDEPITGRFVRVTRLPDADLSGTGGQGNPDEANLLSIGEVEVFGTLRPTCPEEGDPDHGDTVCEDLTVDGPVDQGPGLYIATAFGDDGTGDDILYTFTASESTSGFTLVSGPDPLNSAMFDLSAGEWTITAFADDSRICDDESELAICTEQVSVFPPESENRALLRPSRQSSDYNPSLGASKGNDGDLGNFTATASADDQATWEVDLLEDVDIATILVHNRGDGCCQSRLRDITVSILDSSAEDGTVVFESELLNPENELGGGGTGGPSVIPFDLVAITGGAVTGRVVRVHRTGDPDLSGTGGQGNADEANVLSLGEVEVFDTTCEDTDSECELVEVFGPEDGGPGSYTAIASGVTSGAIFYTFTADNGVDVPVVVGPQETDTAVFNLAPGTWTISVAIGESFRCANMDPESMCTEMVEVRSLGAGENVALGKPATQSSDFSPNLGAQIAVDGDFRNTTATASEDDMPTWEVDLEGVFPINAIVVHNRGDGCCQSRLRDITVFILDEAGEVVWQSELLNEENELGGGTTDGPRRLTVDLRDLEGEDVPGARVRITRLPDPDLSGTGGQGNVDEPNVLSIAEVEVFSEMGTAGPRFIRGDVDASGSINITDGISVLNYLFLGASDPACLDAADTDGSNSLNLTDGVFVLNYLFTGGGDPPAPFPSCGVDPDDDEISCLETQPGCAE